ncbi:hypothetical protein [Ekhidna sp.]|uniref:hypothetical protein n=1 Tax=Ekhidna sp. TaxID=2608089 RepID=UPI003516F033
MKAISKSLFVFLFTIISLQVVGQLSFERVVTNPNDTTETITDITAPQTNLLSTEVGNFTFGPASRVKFEIVEEGSGLETTYFKVADFPYMKSDGRQMLPHDLEDGEHELLFYSVDQNGNQEEVKSALIYVDRRGPQVTPAFNKAPANFDNGLPVFAEGVHLMLEINDAHVDVQKVTYSINGQERVNSEDLYHIDLTEQLSKVTSEEVKIEVIAYDYFYNLTKEVIEFRISK